MSKESTIQNLSTQIKIVATIASLLLALAAAAFVFLNRTGSEPQVPLHRLRLSPDKIVLNGKSILTLENRHLPPMDAKDNESLSVYQSLTQTEKRPLLQMVVDPRLSWQPISRVLNSVKRAGYEAVTFIVSGSPCPALHLRLISGAQADKYESLQTVDLRLRSAIGTALAAADQNKSASAFAFLMGQEQRFGEIGATICSLFLELKTPERLLPPTVQWDKILQTWVVGSTVNHPVLVL